MLTYKVFSKYKVVANPVSPKVTPTTKEIIKAIELNPVNKDAWQSLALSLSPSATIAINDHPYTGKQCNMIWLALEDPSKKTWDALKLAFSDKKNKAALIHIGSYVYTPVHASLIGDLVEDPSDPTRWRALASKLKSNESISIPFKVGETNIALRCTAKTSSAIATLLDNPREAQAWLEVANLLEEGDCVPLFDSFYTKEQCVCLAKIRARMIDPTISIHEHTQKIAQAWLDLGNSLGDRKIKVCGSEFNRQKCFVKAVVESEHYNGNAWKTLAATLSPGETIQIGHRLSNEVEFYTQEQCLILSKLYLNPGDPSPIRDLANSLGEGKGNSRYLKADCVVIANLLENPLDPKHWKAASNLEKLLTIFNFAYFTDQMNSIAVIVDPQAASEDKSTAWSNLAGTLRTHRFPIPIGDEKYSPRTCCLEALKLNPKNKTAWRLLSQYMWNTAGLDGDKKFVSLNGHTYTDVQCVLISKSLEDESNADATSALTKAFKEDPAALEILGFAPQTHPVQQLYPHAEEASETDTDTFHQLIGGFRQVREYGSRQEGLLPKGRLTTYGTRES